MGGGLESRCVGRVNCADGARHRTHDLRSGSQDHHPSKNSVQKTICRNSTSNAPDDGRMYPKHGESRIRQSNYLVASCWHFTLFHEKVPFGSPDLTAIDFCFCVFVKSEVYKRKVDTRDELLARVVDAAARIKKREDRLRRTKRELPIRVAK